MRLAAVRIAVFIAAFAAALPAFATFHLWTIREIFSNADGSVQFVRLATAASGQQFLQGHTLTASGGPGATRVLTFGTNLPGDTAGRSFLVGTSGFAAQNTVTPDFVVPNGFLATGGGTLVFGEGADSWTYAAMPTEGRLSLNRDGTTSAATPRNFASAPTAVPPTATVNGDFNLQGLWSHSPAGTESGWGINIAHQGDILFVTWYTYGTDGAGLWMVLPAARLVPADPYYGTADNTYTGTIYRTSGPAFSSSPFDSARVTRTEVGTGTFAFSDASNGTFSYTVNGVSQSKAITRFVFATPASVCEFPH